MANKQDFITPSPSETNVPTSKFDLTHDNHLSLQFGKAYPCLLYDAPAHSTLRIKPSFGFDFMPFRTPVQSNMRAHVKFYKIPKRILWKDFRAWKTGYGNYVMPYLKRTNNFATTGSLADYMGLPTERIDVADEYFTIGFSPIMAYSRRFFDSNNQAPRYDGMALFSPSYDGTTYKFYGRYAKIDNPLTGQVSAPHKLKVFSKTSISPATTWRLSAHFYYISKNEYDVNSYGYIPIVSEELSYVAPVSAGTVAAGKFTFPTAQKNVAHTFDGNTIAYESELHFSLSTATLDAINAELSQNNSVVMVLSWAASMASVFGDLESNFHVDASQMNLSGALTQYTLYTGQSEEEKFNFGLRVMNVGINPNALLYGKVTHFVNDNTPFISVNGAEPALPINALPFRAYEFIGNYFYRNHEIDPFLVNGQEPFDEYVTTKESGADTETPLDFFPIPYEYDLFSTCVKTPSFGQSPLVPLRGREGDGSQFAEIHMTAENNGVPSEYTIKLKYNSNGTITAVHVNDDAYSEQDPVVMLKDAINYGISVQDFRNVSALQRFQDRMQRVVNGHGSKYYNFVKEFYGTNAPIGEEFPEYLGGVTQSINVSKLMNTGQQENLGEFCGIGSIRADGKGIKCFCSEDCFVIGICYVTCTPVYSQQLPRLFTKSNLLEYANPQFNNITPQPVYKHQIAPLQLTSQQLYDTFGFNVPYAEYRMMMDEAHGNFRTQSMHDYLAQRLFHAAPSLGRDFIYQHNEDFVSVFKSTMNDDKIFGIIHFDMRGCKLPFPRYMTPKII